VGQRKPSRCSEAERNRLALSCQGLAVKEAHQFCTHIGRQAVSQLDDAIQQANLALLAAARLFRPELGFQFTTYATRTMRSQLWRWWNCDTGLIRLPAHHQNKNRPPAPHLQRAASRTRAILSLSDPDLPDPHVGNPRSPDGLEVAQQQERVARVQDALRRLDVRSRYVIRARMNGHVLQEIADRLRVTRERVRQIEKRAMEKLRRVLAGRQVA
jgi:RNA polymerase sigma factor (sigma-70 family)